MPKPETTLQGKVYLVGAGPGDPGLVTLRGGECLARADLVLYDYLVNPRVLEHAAPLAELVCLGRHGALHRLLAQQEINERMVSAALSGATVVRLKAGDPMIFGRAAEEVAALTEAGIDFEIVPGVTSAVALGAYAGIPLTHRELASAVAFVTGHEDTAKHQPALDYEQLARFPGTLVFYMGVTSAAVWSQGLIDGGRSPSTPVALVRRCSWSDQQVIRCALKDVADVIAAEHLRPPVLAVVGEVAAVDSAISWFTTRPLFGKRILITRAAEQAAEFRQMLEDLGATVLIQPAIQIGEPSDWSAVDRAIERIADYDWLVFSSANGVRYFLDRLLAGGGDARQLGRAQLAVIGPGTAATLARYRLKADLQPSEYRAEALAAELAPVVRGKRLLLLRASRGREVLAEELQAAGAQVDQVVVYRSTDIETPDAEIASALEAGTIDYVTVTSSAIARSVVQLFGSALRKARLASISPLTSGVLRDLGYEAAVEAKTYDLGGLVNALRDDQSQTAAD